MKLDGKRILVTGADGFIGSHLVERLVARGCDVRAFVLYNSFNSWGWLDRSPEPVRRALDVFAGDIRDPHGVRTAMQGCDVVLHLAALIAIPYSYHSPDTYVDTNIRGTLNVLQAARELGIERVVHTSTSVTVIRPFNTYGPRQSARAVIPTIITQIAAGARRIRLGALHPTRDFNYVADTVRGFEALAECDAAVGQVANVGSGFEVSIGDTARMIAELMGGRIEIETDGR
jgi:nucleoside-diphosphate-sugar epimerase